MEEQKKLTGFTLFPQPPTPPAKRARTRSKSSSNSSAKLFKARSGSSRGHARKSSTQVANQTTQPELVPAPLKIRKASEDIPPLPALLHLPPPSTPVRSKADTLKEPKTPENAPPRLPAIPQSSPLSPLPQTPIRQGNKFRARTVAEFVELEARTRKRASTRLSQWLDLEDGEVDRRRLSMYLGSVLDNTFELPHFESGPRNSIALRRRISRAEFESLIEQCACPPGAIICHCSSSPEFERFRSWSTHKPNASISSTACLIGIPRARFHLAFFGMQESPITELSSPPGLSFDTEEEISEAGDWSSPRTPSGDDIFSTPSRASRKYSSKFVIPSPSSGSISTPSKFQSFSRPFRPESTHKWIQSEGSSPSTPSRAQSRSTDPKSGYLTSISTMSSFDFDFDYKSRCQSLALQKSRELQTPSNMLKEKEQGSHLRTDSSESLSQTSQYELTTAAATVTMSRSSIKPVLITNPPKRAKTPVPLGQVQVANSTSASTKTSTSSVSIPEYWHQYNAGARAKTRSTNGGSDSTNESVAFSAMLTMPLLSPKPTQSKTQSVVGNAFAQRSNTTGTMPIVVPSHELSQFRFDTSANVPESTLNRSNTTPHLTAHTDDCVDPRLDSHVHAYTTAHARLKAFWDKEENSDKTTVEKSGLGITSTPSVKSAKSVGSTKSTKSYICTDSRISNRGDSGVFGRMGAIGVDLTGMVGRRQFSEPQFYRYSPVDER